MISADISASSSVPELRYGSGCGPKFWGSYRKKKKAQKT